MDSTKHYGCFSMGSNPIKSTKFYIMNKFYTQTISKELLDAIAKKGFPYKTIPVGYNVFEQGGGYPEYATVIPTYAEVLDWLENNDLFLSIGKVGNKQEYFALNPKSIKIYRNKSFIELLEEVIFLSIEFIEPLQAENVSNGTDSY